MSTEDKSEKGLIFDPDKPDISMEHWEELMEWYDGALMADGFEEALVGFGTQFNRPLAIYDSNKCIDILVKRDGMTVDEAIEYMEYNVNGAYVGEETPIFIGDYIREPYYETDYTNR